MYYVDSESLSVTLTRRLGFFHNVCILESWNQSILVSSSCKSYLKNSFAKVVRISIQPRLNSVSSYSQMSTWVTYLRPIQPRGPRENGFEAFKSSLLFFPSHLSGLKTWGSSKLAGSRLAATGLVDTMVLSSCQQVACKGSRRCYPFW